MFKLLIIVALVLAGIQFLPMEFLIVIACVPAGLALGMPIARCVERVVDGLRG